MAAPRMDLLTAFNFLTDNLPTWLAQLEELNKTVIAKHASFIQQAPVVKKAKADSVESIHPDEACPKQLPSPGRMNQPTALPLDDELLRKHPFRYHQRKHSLASAKSASAHPRTRSMIVVYYDSAIQKSFEQLVRNIGTARNNLRKARMSSSLPSVMMRRRFKFETSVDDPDMADLNMLDFVSSRLSSKGSSPLFEEDSKLKAADTADKGLESAQCLCEVAAHQYLRDGDCTMEIEGCKENFEKTLGIATEQAEKLRREQEKQQELSAKIQLETVDKERVSTTNQGTKTDAATSPGVLEVDDSASDSSIEIDLTAFRTTRNRGIRV